MKRALAAMLLLAGCGREQRHEAVGAGARLEAAASAAGIIPAAGRSLTGSWAFDTDHACAVPVDARDNRLGVLVDYGDGQGCAGTGTVRRDGDRLDVRLGACRIAARLDGGRIVFPAEVPGECQALCTGRASLDAFTVEQVSGSLSEAATLRTPSGRALCGAD